MMMLMIELGFFFLSFNYPFLLRENKNHIKVVLLFSSFVIEIVFLLLQDVAVKVFSKQEYSDDVIHSFRKEVCLLVILLL